MGRVRGSGARTNTLENAPCSYDNGETPRPLPHAEKEGDDAGESITEGEEDVDAQVREVAESGGLDGAFQADFGTGGEACPRRERVRHGRHDGDAGLGRERDR